MQQDLLLKLSDLENESKGLIDGLKADVLKKQDEIDFLHKEVKKSEENIDSLQKRVVELENTLEEKAQLAMELKTREKQLEDQKAEVFSIETSS